MLRAGLVWRTSLALAVVASGQAFAQGAENAGRQPATTWELALDSTIAFPNPPPAMLVTETKCGPAGDIYLVESLAPPSVQSGQGMSNLPVLRLSLRTTSTVAYAVPQIDGYRGLVRTDFDVNPDGKLYSLLQRLRTTGPEGDPPSYLVANYESDGTFNSFLKLAEPPGAQLQPFRLAMFRGGNVLVIGTKVDSKNSIREFATIFDNIGRFVRYVTLRKPGNQEPEHRKSAGGIEPSVQAVEGGIELSSGSLLISGTDGNVYVIQGASRPRAYVVAPAGEVVRDFEIEPPLPHLRPTNADVVPKRGMFVAFGQVSGSSPDSDTPGPPGHIVSLFSTISGEVLGQYRLPAKEAEFSLPACGNLDGQLEFLGSSSDGLHQTVGLFPLR